MDETISVLTSQLQRKFADLEKIIKDVSKNESCRIVEDLENKFLELYNNHTDMLSDLTIAKNKNKKRFEDRKPGDSKYQFTNSSTDSKSVCSKSRLLSTILSDFIWICPS